LLGRVNGAAQPDRQGLELLPDSIVLACLVLLVGQIGRRKRGQLVQQVIDTVLDVDVLLRNFASEIYDRRSEVCRRYVPLKPAPLEVARHQRIELAQRERPEETILEAEIDDCYRPQVEESQFGLDAGAGVAGLSSSAGSGSGREPIQAMQKRCSR